MRLGKTEKMMKSVKSFFTRAERYSKEHGFDAEMFGWRDIMNNDEWLDAVSAKEFFSLVGSNIRLGPMLARDRYNICPTFDSYKSDLD